MIKKKNNVQNRSNSMKYSKKYVIASVHDTVYILSSEQKHRRDTIL